MADRDNTDAPRPDEVEERIHRFVAEVIRVAGVLDDPPGDHEHRTGTTDTSFG
ncbi:hypothetical protein [Kutzneria sp. NPDC051319]|uniref:hypothetical protein n=1 Tax=Kutzneria sp. NPDC051319 TaxID=3155047 RepID=UPI0034225A4E